MGKQSATAPYEVYCLHCNVTFPVTARRCLHCGGRLARERIAHPVAPDTSFLDQVEPLEEEEGSSRSPFSPVLLLWLLVFVVGTIYRACTGG